MGNDVSTGDIGKILSVPSWRIRRLYEDGDLPDPPRIGLARAIPRASIPAIIDALRARGWLAEAAESPADPLDDDAADLAAKAIEDTLRTPHAAAESAAAVGTEALHGR